MYVCRYVCTHTTKGEEGELVVKRHACVFPRGGVKIKCK